MSEPTDARGMSCDEFAGVAAELALGVLTGRERAAALAHLDVCECCRELVRELTMTGEELLALLPSREPPAGFETRVLERIGLPAPNPPRAGHRPSAPRRADRDADRPAAARPPAARPPGRPSSRMRRVLSSVAVVVALVLAGLGGWGLRDATSSSAPSSSAQSAVNTAALVTAAHQNVGMVFLYNRTQSWMYMSVNLGDIGNITVKCQLENVHGQFTTIGNFTLSDGYGTWGSPYATGGGIVGARLLNANNTVLATATFS
jgi:hypothetical protein